MEIYRTSLFQRQIVSNTYIIWMNLGMQYFKNFPYQYKINLTQQFQQIWQV